MSGLYSMKTKYFKILLLLTEREIKMNIGNYSGRACKITKYDVNWIMSPPTGSQIRNFLWDDTWGDTHQITQCRVLQRSDNTLTANQASHNTRRHNISQDEHKKKKKESGNWRQLGFTFSRCLWVNSLDETLWHMMCHISKAGHQ